MSEHEIANKAFNEVGYLCAGFYNEIPIGTSVQLYPDVRVSIVARATYQEVKTFCDACGMPVANWPFHYKVVMD